MLILKEIAGLITFESDREYAEQTVIFSPRSVLFAVFRWRGTQGFLKRAIKGGDRIKTNLMGDLRYGAICHFRVTQHLSCVLSPTMVDQGPEIGLKMAVEDL